MHFVSLSRSINYRDLNFQKFSIVIDRYHLIYIFLYVLYIMWIKLIYSRMEYNTATKIFYG